MRRQRAAFPGALEKAKSLTAGRFEGGRDDYIGIEDDPKAAHFAGCLVFLPRCCPTAVTSASISRSVS